MAKRLNSYDQKYESWTSNLGAIIPKFCAKALWGAIEDV